MTDFFEESRRAVGTTGDHVLPREHTLSGHSGPVFTPDHVVSVLLGQQSIVLNGFGEIDEQLSAKLPNVPLYLLSDARHQEALIQEVNKTWRVKVWMLSALVLVLVLATGLGVGWMMKSSSELHSEALVWRASRVQSDGVMIWMADREVLFPLGGMLPSGEELRQVDPARQTYTTNAQIVTLSPKSGTVR